MRLFVGLDVDEQIRARIASFLLDVREFAAEARWVRPESLHVTLKFIGEQPEQEVERIQHLLETIECDAVKLTFSGCGFFPSAGAPRLFWVGIESGTDLTMLAQTVNEKLARLGVPQEKMDYVPHVTLARSGKASEKHEGRGRSRNLPRLREELAKRPPPKFGTMTARDFVLYQSQPFPGGSKYTRLAGFKLRVSD